MPDISVQLYTVRDALAADFDGTLAALAGYGYTLVEPYAFVDFLEELRTGLPAHGLAAPTTHVGLLDGDQASIFAAATELDISTLIVPSVNRARWLSQDETEIRAIAQELNAAAVKAAEYGLRVGYHNHEFELTSKINGRHALEVMADHLDSEVVLEIDTYWAYAGGADVPGLLERLGNRVVALHIKDGDGSLDTKKQVPVGSGSLPVWDFMAAAPHALRVVELDDTEGDVVDATRASRDYLLSGAGA
jgi:sugar phosphate isomerase/epimerase